MNHSLQKKLLLFGLLLCLVTFVAPPSTAQQPTGEGLLVKGDSIEVYIDIEDFEAMKTKSAGSKFRIKVLNHVDRFGNNLVTKFTPVYCTVFKRSRGGMYGSAGTMVFTIDSTHSTAGTKVPLKGEGTLKGKSKRTLAIILFPIGWAMKGSDVQFPEGKNVFKSVVAEDTPLEYLR